MDICISRDEQRLWVNTFMDGKTRLFDMSDPHHPEADLRAGHRPQVNMVSQSWDGKRVYFTSSLLANWDKKGEDNEQFLKALMGRQGAVPRFAIDFNEQKLGRPHQMRFGAYSLYAERSPQSTGRWPAA